MAANNDALWNDTQRDRPPSGIRVVVLLLVAAAVTAGGYLAYRHSQRQEQLTQVTAPTGRLALGLKDVADLQEVNRAAVPEVVYHVILQQAPLGSGITLDCQWIDPQDNIVHQNHYTTQPIDKPVWPTHARWQCNAASPQGKWTVRMLLDGRVLCERKFDLVDVKP